MIWQFFLVLWAGLLFFGGLMAVFLLWKKAVREERQKDRNLVAPAMDRLGRQMCRETAKAREALVKMAGTEMLRVIERWFQEDVKADEKLYGEKK